MFCAKRDIIVRSWEYGSNDSIMWGFTAMSFLKSFLGSCPFAYIFFSAIAATCGSFIHLLMPLKDVLTDHFELDNLTEISYTSAISAAVVISLVIFILNTEQHRDYVCFFSIAMLSPVYAFLIFAIYYRKSNYLTYVIFIGISGLVFGAITCTLLSAASTLNPITSTSYLFGSQVGTMAYSLYYYYASYSPSQYTPKLRSEVLYKMHIVPLAFGLAFALLFLIYVKSSSFLDAQAKNDAGGNQAPGTGRLSDNLKDLVNTYIASGMIAFSILIESGFIPNLVPNALKMAYEENLTVIILNAFYTSLGALISGIIPLFPQSLAFKCVLFPINLIRIPALIFASQTQIIEVTHLYICSVVAFSGMLHGYSVGSSFASLSVLSKANKSKAFELNAFFYILFLAIGSGCSLVYVKFA